MSLGAPAIQGIRRQTKKEQERLIAAYRSEMSNSAYAIPRCALGFAALLGVGLFGAAIDPGSPDLVAQLEARRGRLEVEQASVRSRLDVYEARKATRGRMLQGAPASPQRENAAVGVSGVRATH